MSQFNNQKLIILVSIGITFIGIAQWQFSNFSSPQEPAPVPEPVNNTQVKEPAVPPATTTPPESTEEPIVKKEETPPTPVVPPPPPPPPAPIIPEVVELTVEGNEFMFSPNSFTVKRGSTVELTFKNIGRVPHDFVVDELGIKTKTIGGGKTDMVSFTVPDSPGVITYTSYCSVPGHKESGMVGTITIE